MEKGDWPKYVDTIRPMYEAEELTAMFKVATEDEADMLKFILGSGFRDQEIRYRRISGSRLPESRSCARHGQEEMGLHAEELGGARRALSSCLMERLKKRKERKKARPHDLIFGNTKGNPDSEMDMVVKRVAERAGLNCGRA